MCRVECDPLEGVNLVLPNVNWTQTQEIKHQHSARNLGGKYHFQRELQQKIVTTLNTLWVQYRIYIQYTLLLVTSTQYNYQVTVLDIKVILREQSCVKQKSRNWEK